MRSLRVPDSGPVSMFFALAFVVLFALARKLTKRAAKAARKRRELLLLPGFDPYAQAGDCRYDQEAAQRAVDFFRECLTHVKGSGEKWAAGSAFELLPWQVCLISNMFGWKRPDGTRRFREVFVYIPRKNGKTTLLAGLLLYVLLCDGEPGAEIYSAAADREQARLLFEQARDMVAADETLSSICQTFRNALKYGTSSYKALSADAHTKHGLNSHFIVIDELHAQPNRELTDVLTTSTGARRQPMVVYITTADYARPSICNEKLKYAKQVRDGLVVDASFLPAVWEAALADDWKDPRVWAKVNPSLGQSVRLEYLQAECDRAQNVPGYLNTFLRLHLNVQTEADVAWLRMDHWDNCPPNLVEIPNELLALCGRDCWGGLDLSTTTDLSALALVFPPKDDSSKVWSVLVRFWAPEAACREREKRDRVPYSVWAREGWLKLTPGDVVDYDYIRAEIGFLRSTYNIREIAADRWNATQLLTQLAGDGFEIREFGQGFRSMSAPTKELERLVVSRLLAHFGNPVLRWCASNTVVEYDAAGNVKPAKNKSTQRIDGVVATIMALGQAASRDGATAPSVYETRGVIAL